MQEGMSELRDKFGELHTQLETHDLEAEEREELETAIERIQQELILRQLTRRATHRPTEDTLSESLQRKISSIGEKHPILASTLQGVVNILGQMGI